jgi:hypothetical protein
VKKKRPGGDTVGPFFLLASGCNAGLIEINYFCEQWIDFPLFR